MSINTPINFVNSISIRRFAGEGVPFILADTNTARHCVNEIALPNNAVIIEIKAGEQNKNLLTCTHIWQELTHHNADRNAVLLNIGGGMVCDIGGFAASCYKRGIRFVHIPTSLLAMADAAIGGKTGIDFNGYKNQIGSFANAEEVVIYPQFLETLPERELISGMAEVIKHYLIADETAFSEFAKSGMPLTSETGAWQKIIEQAIAIKTSITQEDPFEKGARKKLNFGHTVGHAVESHFLDTSNPLLHGEAIAIGMIAELLIASELKLIATPEADKAIDILVRFFTPDTVLDNTGALLKLMQQDKKNLQSKLLFALPNRIGHCLYNCEVTEDVIKKSIAAYNERIIA